MSETKTGQPVLVFGDPPRKKNMRKMACAICGHEWTSYSYGAIIKCPECYKRSTGKSCGPGAEKMAEIRARRKNAQPAAAPPDPPKKPESWLEKVLNMKIGG